jgi:hypothetical protein
MNAHIKYLPLYLRVDLICLVYLLFDNVLDDVVSELVLAKGEDLVHSDEFGENGLFFIFAAILEHSLDHPAAVLVDRKLIGLLY